MAISTEVDYQSQFEFSMWKEIANHFQNDPSKFIQHIDHIPALALESIKEVQQSYSKKSYDDNPEVPLVFRSEGKEYW